MPISFTATTPSKYYLFPFEKFMNLDALENNLGSLPFFENWREFWLKTFKEEDEFLKSNLDSVVNPIKRLESKPEYIGMYEMYNFEYVTPVGSYFYKFDVEKMKYLVHHHNIQEENIDTEFIFVDPSTPFMKSKVIDSRLPFLVRFYGAEKPFLCVDGNKRMRAKIGIEKINTVNAYLFGEPHRNAIFFDKLDMYFYAFHHEVDCLFFALEKGLSADEIYDLTHMSQLKKT
ncbi:hypothetical protein P9D26_10170 [Bacillus velezensis]|uniref:hypothetical protein n=1 Tax=Bacillus velezensis TaxID=492670 RepID=UPI002DB7558C|nr:hypothetical protein [Bacillus velezensis]MEC1393698.1 hypothetical protein [Bacillus velezensis]